jgi:hypothetical protein
METILNDKSKAYERITIDMLLSYIKNNLSTLQPTSSVIIVDRNDKIDKNDKNDRKDKKNDIPKTNIKSFYDELINSNSKIKFNSDFIKPLLLILSNNTDNNESFYVINYTTIIFPDKKDTETSDSNTKKKVDYSKFSFFKSLIYCLISKPKESDLENLIKTLVKHIMYGGITEFGYTKLKWNKKTLKDNINNNIIDESTIRVISDYLHINIFVINEDSKQIEYGGAEFVPFKKNIFIYKYKDNFYPIFTKDGKFFKFTSPLVKYLLTNTQKITLLSHDQLTFKEEDLSKYINLATIMPEIPVNVKGEEVSVINKFEEDFTECDINGNSDDSDNSDDNNDNNSDDNSDDNNSDDNISENDNANNANNVIFDKYIKLSLMEIQKEAKKLNINIKDNNNKLKNKNLLCMEITKYKKIN